MSYLDPQDMRDARKRNRQKKRIFVLNYLKNNPCIDCGEIDIRVLDFDHIDPSKKEYQISKIVSGGWGIEKLEKEIEKCSIRCANCHRKRHFNSDWHNIIISPPKNKQVKKEWRHGTKNSYSYRKCRCTKCTEAQRKYMVKYRNKNASVA